MTFSFSRLNKTGALVMSFVEEGNLGKSNISKTAAI
jgi:hypothetical protein